MCRNEYVILLCSLIDISESKSTKGLQYFNKYSYSYNNTKQTQSNNTTTATTLKYKHSP